MALLGTVAVSAFRGVHPDMRIAYRLVALPMALVAGSIIFVLALVMETCTPFWRRAAARGSAFWA